MPVALIAEQQVVHQINEFTASNPDQICEFALGAEEAPTKYALRIESGTWQVELRATSKLLVGVSGNHEDCTQHVFDALNRIAYWERILKLQNNATKLEPDDVDFHLLEVDGEDVEHRIDTEDFTFDVKQDGNMFRGKLRARNTTNQELHFALLYLSTDYGVAIPYNMAIDPTDAAFEFVFPAPDNAESPFVFAGLDDGVKESHFFLRLLVSTERVDDF